MKTSSKFKTLVGLPALLALAAISTSLLTRDTARHLYDCQNNLKTIGTAMEMYSTDWQGHYPPRIDMLVPRYLPEIPVCPAAGFMTYQMEYGPNAPHNERGFQDYYFIYCAGDFHRRQHLPAGYPQYDGVSSVMER